MQLRKNLDYPQDHPYCDGWTLELTNNELHELREKAEILSNIFDIWMMQERGE